MKKRIVLILVGVFCCTSLVACGKKETSAPSSVSKEESSEPTNLSGTWKEEKDGSYQEATITNDTIEINWVSPDSTSLYWAGTYTAPDTATDEYSWVSENDHEKTDAAMLASSDDTKEFTYKNGVITYEVSALGTTQTVELVKQ